MQNKEQSKSAQLINHLRHWGWPHTFGTLDQSTLFIAEDDFFDEFTNLVGRLKCQTSNPLEFKDFSQFEGILQILVFIKKGEKALVKSLRKHYPDINIISAQYDLAPNSIGWPAKLPNCLNKSDAKRQVSPIILLSTPYSDGEYLSELMHINGLGRPVEYTGKPLLKILDNIEDFHLLHYLDAVHRLNAKDETVFLHIQTDFLEALVEKKLISFNRIKILLRQSRVKVIRFSRQDLLYQAASQTLMDRRPLRSIWTMLPSQKKTLSGKLKVNFQSANIHFQHLGKMEQLLDTLLADHPKLHNVTLENLISDPQNQLEQIAKFISAPKLQEVKTISYREEYEKLDPLSTTLSQLGKEMIDRLGLHTRSINT